jgi:hypothetical protein
MTLILTFAYLFIGSARAVAVATDPFKSTHRPAWTDIAINTLLWPWLTLVNIFWKLYD